MKNIFLVLALAVLIFAKSEYEEWLTAQSDQFENKKAEQDEEFLQKLKNDWKEFESFKQINPLPKPKPATLPKAQLSKIKQKSNSVKIKEAEVKQPILIPTIEVTKEATNIDFYGAKLSFTKDCEPDFSLDAIEQEQIANFWLLASKSNYQTVKKELLFYQNKLNLNDYALFELTQKLALEVYSDKNVANLYAWFLMSKLGYDFKVGFDSSKIYLLVNTKKQVFQAPYFVINSKKYFIFNAKKVGKIFIYQASYQENVKPLDLDIKTSIAFLPDLKEKTLTFSYMEKPYKIITTYNKNLVDFYKNYPQADYTIYFDASISPFVKQSLLKEITKNIEGKSEYEAVNFILNFVQKAFEYKTDADQFGYEKIMFPSETIFYPYSDCEDRSIIFAYIIKELLGLKIVGIKYQDHIATAVAFSSPIKGDKVKFDNTIYTICDPTYINAKAGQAMPKYKKSKFEIIKIKF